MPEFRIEPMPSRSLKSDKVVYYVRSRSTNKLITKFDTSVLHAEEIEGWETFNSFEKLELQSYLASIRFTIDTLGLPAKLNRDYRFILPEPLQVAIAELYNRAQANNIVFNPMSAMLSGLVNHITTIEKRLNTLGESSVLADFEIKLRNDGKEELSKDLRKYTKKIFKHLQSLRGGLEKYSKMALELYDNDTNLNSATLLKYVEGTSKPSQWSISCALTVLGKEEDLNDIVPISTIVTLWLKPLRFSGKLKTEEQALSLFEKIFKLNKKYYDEARDQIHQEMKNFI